MRNPPSRGLTQALALCPDCEIAARSWFGCAAVSRRVLRVVFAILGSVAIEMRSVGLPVTWALGNAKHRSLRSKCCL